VPGGVKASAANPGWTRLASALDCLEVPVVLVDDGRPVHINPAGAALIAHDPGEPPDDLAVIASSLSDAAGNHELVVLSAQTLDAALTEPEEHAESRRQLNQAQAVARIGSWTADMIKRRVDFSDQQYRLYGLEPQSRHVDIQTFLSLVHPEDRAAMAAAVDRAALEGKPFKLEHRLADEGAGVGWIEARCEPVLSRGRVVRMVGTCMDITERKRHEESLKASLAEVRASRIRIVSAADDERRRVERDLHDGAQQRLVSLTMALRLARTQLDEQADPTVVATLQEISEELRLALAELRDLARGIHPALLTERGLAPALESLVLRSPVPATVLSCPDRRLPGSLEIAIYYLAAEALTNAIKHARASRVTISVSPEDRCVLVEICDDGEGGADIAHGTGLRGLADRVSALDGKLSIHSPPGAGTTLTAELPCE
jgi:PAS domain S-box-containing protein